ncbi:MAG: glycosyltransferase family 2 protein [Planctomycetes bacterium]|nr:glycosyltransferase family 2 protein [Planctomycetota bacterium]
MESPGGQAGSAEKAGGIELSVVVPCYNEQEVLAEMHRRTSAVCQGLGISYEIILIDDGSKDGTWQKMNELAAADGHLTLVKLSRNHGHQLALSAGLEIARGEKIFVIDADLQDPPETLPEMMKLLNEGADVVYGQRRSRPGESRFKLWSASLFYRLLSRMSETRIPQNTGDFRLMSRRVVDVLRQMPEKHRFVRGMVSWVGFNQKAFLYDRDQRFAGVTKYPFSKMMTLAISGITAFSTKPLRLATFLGCMTALIGVGILIWAVVSHFLGWTTTGWASIIGVVVLLSSVQLFVLGVYGEYIGRMYEQSQGRPLFIIEQVKPANGTDPQNRSSSPKHSESDDSHAK